MTIHYLAGTPRSGSTLLGNILAQHPDVHVSGTSPLFDCVDAVANVLSNHPEIVSQLAHRPGAYDTYLSSLRALMSTWHADADAPVVIDKCRGWPKLHALTAQLDPDSRMICCIRDPRDVVASIERHHRRTAAFHSPIAPTLYEMADKVMSPQGIVGGPVRLVEDMIRRRAPIVWVRFESFTIAPGPTLASLIEAIDLAPFDFDLDAIENTSPDMDAIYRGKYPHDGAGPLKPVESHWSDVMNDEIAGLIAGVAPLYMQTFAYDANGLADA